MNLKSNLEARLQNVKVLDTHSTQPKYQSS